MSEDLPFDTNFADPDLIPRLGDPPFALFAQWRRDDVVNWNPPPANDVAHLTGASMKQGFWVLTRYDDVVEASRDPSGFCFHVEGSVIWDFDPEQLALQQAGRMGIPIEQYALVKRLV